MNFFIVASYRARSAVERQLPNTGNIVLPGTCQVGWSYYARRGVLESIGDDVRPRQAQEHEYHPVEARRLRQPFFGFRSG